MAESREQLVQRITERVLAALDQRRRGGASGSPGRGGTPRPPAGVCTGDYSQFPELNQAGSAPPRPREASPSPAPPTPPAPSPSFPGLTGFVTARQLQDAMQAASDGVARLESGAKLTPLARDLARERPEKVRRTAESEPGG